ncbi:hypothetical protein B484DRAFT_444964 [Ochromonadaceae sp. CCMP2298]|nr:hypothetical protein B484DRAFT_444964 [Ochromonadaceae sp. CCMP2298]
MLFFVLAVPLLGLCLGAPAVPSSSSVGAIRGGGGRSFNDNDAAYRSEFVFGKDRELVHASVDLKWLFGTLTDGTFWQSLAEAVLDRIRRLQPAYDDQYHYKQEAIEMLLNIRFFNSESTLRVFQRSMQQAQALSLSSRRFIVLYIEAEEAVEAPVEALEYRRALADSILGDLLNAEYIFMACSRQHPYAKAIRQRALESVGGKAGRGGGGGGVGVDGMGGVGGGGLIRDSVSDFSGDSGDSDGEFPMFLVLAPALTEGTFKSTQNSVVLSPRTPFELVGALRPIRTDAQPHKIRAFLSRVAEAHAGRFDYEDGRGGGSGGGASGAIGDSEPDGGGDSPRAGVTGVGKPLDESVTQPEG